MYESNTLYKKVGDEYVAVSEYSEEMNRHFHKGAHLVICEPGITMYRYNIEPANAAIAAAATVFADNLAAAFVQSSYKIRSDQLTPEQIAMWEQFISSVLSSSPVISSSSYADIAISISQVAANKVESLLKVPAVQKAYDHFLLMCKIAAETEEV